MVTAPHKGKIKVGTRFVGNMNGAEFVVIDIKPCISKYGTFNTAIVQELKHGGLFMVGLEMLEHMLITIKEE